MANNFSKVLLAGLAGVAAGVAIGILIAPAKGSKTRKKLKKGFHEISNLEGEDFSGKIRSFADALTSDDEEDEKEPSSVK